MKNLLVLHGDSDKTGINQDFAEAYKAGAAETGALVKEVFIMDLKFNPNKQFNNQLSPLEPDLQQVYDKVLWSNHIVLFCTVNHESIPAKLLGFFDRLFNPGQPVFADRNRMTSMMYAGKSARIVSVLDEQSWEEWKVDKKPTYHSIKRTVLERCRINPVRTCTIGYVRDRDNDYAKKWLQKMHGFGSKFM